mgnify:CR=1 FL=1
MKFAGSLTKAERDKARIEIFGVPFDGNAVLKGARKGPMAIRRASHTLETFLWHKEIEISEILFADAGDIAVSFPPRREFEEKFEVSVQPSLRSERRKIFLGGDHSVTFALVKHLFERGFVEKVFVLDAHADFRESYKGNRFSNACVLRRIVELVGAENVVAIGVRSASAEEYEALHFRRKRGRGQGEWQGKKKGELRIYDAWRVREDLRGVLSELASERSVAGKNAYLSVDVDVLDPCFAPAVEYPEPCGLSVSEVLSLINGIFASSNVVAADVVEVNPRMERRNRITSVSAARIVMEILACMHEQEEGEK